MSLEEAFGIPNDQNSVEFGPDLMSAIRNVFAGLSRTYDAQKVGINPEPMGLPPGTNITMSADLVYYTLMDVGYAVSIAALVVSLLIIFKFRSFFLSNDSFNF